jgi:hypothetical protein
MLATLLVHYIPLQNYTQAIMQNLATWNTYQDRMAILPSEQNGDKFNVSLYFPLPLSFLFRHFSLISTPQLGICW